MAGKGVLEGCGNGAVEGCGIGAVEGRGIGAVDVRRNGAVESAGTGAINAVAQDGGMPAVLMLTLAAVAAYAGFQWTVHVVVYRQFSAVPAAAFPEYERLHQQRITRVVGPLFAVLVASVCWLLIDLPAGVPLWSALAAAGLVLAILAITGLGAVPLHRRLSKSWDGGTYRALLRVDLVRTVIATGNLVLIAICSVSLS